MAIIIVLFVVVGGIAYHRGWFGMKAHDSNGDGPITITVKPNRIDR